MSSIQIPAPSLPVTDDCLAQVFRYIEHLRKVWREGCDRYGEGVPTLHPNPADPRFPRFGFLPFPTAPAVLTRTDRLAQVVPFAIVAGARIYLVGKTDDRTYPPKVSTVQGSHLYGVDASAVVMHPFPEEK